MANQFDDVTTRLGFRWVGEKVEVSDAAIRAFESEFGHRLPDDYREFLRTYGMTAGTGLEFPSGGGVEVFYGLQEDGEFNLKEEWEGMQGRVPDHCLPVADSPGGLICMSFAPSEAGAIYWWASEDCRSSEEELTYVAPSFSAFMASLSLEEEGS